MTDTAQERVEDWTDEELSRALFALAENMRRPDFHEIDWYDEDEVADEVEEAARRLRARQREDRDGCTCRANYTGSRPGWQVRGDCPVHGATPQREGERESVPEERLEEAVRKNHAYRGAFDDIDWLLSEVDRLRSRQREDGGAIPIYRLEQAMSAAFGEGVRVGAREAVDAEKVDRMWTGSVTRHEWVESLDVTPQQDGGREPDEDGYTVEVRVRETGLRPAIVNGLYYWTDLDPHDDEAWFADRVIEEARKILYTEPPAKPDLDELTPRCPACKETMHDCECNPYMGSEEDDG